MLFADTASPASGEAGDAELRPSRAYQAFSGVDAHAHVFRHDTPMIDGRRYTPTYDATLADYLAVLDANGISHGVIIPVSIFGTDNDYLLCALRQEPRRLRGIVAVAADIPAAKLRSLAAVGVVGVRLNLIGLPDPELASPEWREHLRRIADLGWQVEIQAEARRLPTLMPPLLSAGVDIVIDHFGRPDDALGVADPGFQYLLTVGQTGRVWVKLSGAYRNGSHGERLGATATRLLLRQFSADRLLWGSDWPHTCFEDPHAFRRARRALDDWVTSQSERNRLLVDTPRRLFRFDAEPRT